MTTPLEFAKPFLTDGGIETTLIFHEGWELPEFAAFPLIDTPSGKAVLSKYFERFIQLAHKHRTGFVLESPTWRASHKWAKLIGYNERDLKKLLSGCMNLMNELRADYQSPETPMLISGCVGPNDDGYLPKHQLCVDEATKYHSTQIEQMADEGADFITALTMTYPEEAIGITNAAHRAGVPAVIGFTVETDGTLPTGLNLKTAIHRVDQESIKAPAYYMINCAHPDHFSDQVNDETWCQRVFGVRANASRMSHAELDEAEVLDDGIPSEFGELHAQLKQCLPHLKVFGGCCGTDHRHVDAVAQCLGH